MKSPLYMYKKKNVFKIPLRYILLFLTLYFDAIYSLAFGAAPQTLICKIKIVCKTFLIQLPARAPSLPHTYPRNQPPVLIPWISSHFYIQYILHTLNTVSWSSTLPEYIFFSFLYMWCSGGLPLLNPPPTPPLHNPLICYILARSPKYTEEM